MLATWCHVGLQVSCMPTFNWTHKLVEMWSLQWYQMSVVLLAGSYLVMNSFMTSQQVMLHSSHSVILGSCNQCNTVPLIYTSVSTVIQSCIYLLFGEMFLALQTFCCLEADYVLWWNNNRGQPIKCLTEKKIHFFEQSNNHNTYFYSYMN